MRRMWTWVVAAAIILGALPGPAAAASPPPAFADDFSTPLGDRWEIHGGAWEIVDGRLQGLGEADQLTAPDTATGGAVDLAGAVAAVDGLTATNVTVCLDMTSLEREDKGIVLRWLGPNDGIWLGFRGRDADSDLTVAQAVKGTPTLLTPEFSVPIPAHDIGDTIHICATLVGQRLRVEVDEERVLDRTFPFRVRAGAVGVHALADNLVTYDNVRVDPLAAPDTSTDATAHPATGRPEDVPVAVLIGLCGLGWLLAGSWLRWRLARAVRR